MRYATVNQWSEHFEGEDISISSEEICTRIETSEIAGIKGRDKSGEMADFYSEKDVFSVCADILNKPNSHAA